MSETAKTPADLPLDAVAQALGLDIFNYNPADVLRMVGALQDSEHHAAQENLRLKEQLAMIRTMATRSVPQCINLEAIDRVLATRKEVVRAA